MNNLEIAQQQFLLNSDISEHDLQNVLGKILGPTIDSADLYFESTRAEGWSLEDSIVKEGSHSIRQGVGVRAISGEKTGFAYTDEILLPTLTDAASTARAIATLGQDGNVPQLRNRISQRLYQPLDPIDSLNAHAKVALLNELDSYLRARDPRVTQVMVGLTGQQSVILVAASDGTYSADVRPLIRLNITVFVEQNGRKESATSGGGGRTDYSWLLEEDRYKYWADEALRLALVNLEADAAPAGNMDVVLGPGWPGILLHEAIGHGLEGDFNRKGTSAFSGRIGERVASPLCTVVDDGTLPERRGSLTVDDEGTQTESTTLIENGILRAYMQDKHNARLMGVASTGNGRRESYAHRPMPRMTNTYMLAGQHDPQEIIGSVKKGLYACNFGGGQVDITNGKFVFTTSEAYLIEDGKITRPVKGATLIGNGPDVLTRVSMLGNDMALDKGVGTCGKNGQSVPVGVGQPSMKIDGLTVGGTSA